MSVNLGLAGAGGGTAGASARTAGDTALSRISDEDLRSLLRIRHTEKRIQQLFTEGEVAGTTHLCLGQEYVPVSLTPLLAPPDFVFSNHRGHGHYLARTGDLAGLLAEVMGRTGAPCRGIGGSQHLRRDRYLSSGVQGQTLSVAAGTALHLQRAGTEALACAYIGDGTWGEGAVYEALNLAALWRLPLLVVVEHNGIAQTTPTRLQMAGSVAGRARAFRLAHVRVTALDVNQIRREVSSAVAGVRAGRPAIVEFRTYRLGPHSKGDDTRHPAEVRDAAEHDWYELYRRTHPDHFAAWDEVERRAVEAVAREVTARPPAR
jgi:pyruvate dehydrogenase E1 component alpha subunit